MIKAFLLFLWPSKLVEMAASEGQDKDQAAAAIREIRFSYTRAIATIFLICVAAIGLAHLINQLGGLSAEKLIVVRFICSALIALAVLAKLSWEIQTYKGETIPEAVNTYLFKLFYQVGLIGMLASILVTPT